MDECWGLEARGLRLEAKKQKQKTNPVRSRNFFFFFLFSFFFPPTTGVSNPVRSHDFSDNKKIAGSNGLFVFCFAFLFSFLFHSLYMRKVPKNK